MSRISETYDNVRLTSFVRQVPQRTGPILDQYLPNVMVQTRHYSIEVLDETNGRSQFRAFDTPVRVAPRPQGQRRTGSLPPLGESMVIGENDTLGIYERAIAGDFDDLVDGAIQDDAVRLVRRMQNAAEWARGQILSTGSLTLAGENGLDLTAPMGVPPENLPGGDASTTAATDWSNPAADILGELYTLQERSRDEVGSELVTHICSSATIRNMQNNNAIRAALASNGTTPALAGMAGLTGVMQSYGLPVPVRYDYQVAGQRVIDADRSVLLPQVDPDDFGRSEWGTTAEAIKLDMARDLAPGISAVVLESDEPVHCKTKVSGLMMPVLNDARKLYVFDQTP